MLHLATTFVGQFLTFNISAEVSSALEKKDALQITAKSILMLNSSHMCICVNVSLEYIRLCVLLPPHNSERREMDRSIKQDVTPKHNND